MTSIRARTEHDMSTDAGHMRSRNYMVQCLVIKKGKQLANEES